MGSAGGALLRLLPLLLALLGPGSSEDAKVVNALVGTTVHLKVTHSGTATGYTWKKENTLVADWDYPDKVTYFEMLKGRCHLDISTGVLTIRDLKEEDSAGYQGQALVNNHYDYSNYDLRVFRSLNNPTVTCPPTGGNYTILCTHQPEPPTYTWRSKDRLVAGEDYWLTNLNKTLILKSVKSLFQSLECVVQNPVSNKSAPVPADCFKDLIKNEGENNRERDGFIAAVIVCLLAVAILYGFYQCIVSRVSKVENSSAKDEQEQNCSQHASVEPGDGSAGFFQRIVSRVSRVFAHQRTVNDEAQGDNAECPAELNTLLKGDPNHSTDEVTGVLVHQGTGNDDAQGDNANCPAEHSNLLEGDPNHSTDEVTADNELPLESRNIPKIDGATDNRIEVVEVVDVADNLRHQKDEDSSQARPNTDPDMEKDDECPVLENRISSSHHSQSCADINGDKTASEAKRTVEEP